MQGRSTQSISELDSSQGLLRALEKLTSLKGSLLCDREDLASAGRDFGNIVHKSHLALLRPGSRQDIVDIVNFARQQSIHIAARGRGHSVFGQSQAGGGIVLEMGSLVEPTIFQSESVEVSAGLSWRDVLKETLPRGLRPPVLTENTGLSVGGTLSMGGIDGRSWQFGTQVDNVLALEVVTGEGQILICSESENSELYNAVLAGLGQCAIILRVKIKLIPAPSHARLIRYFYPDLASMLNDERELISSGRADRVVGNVWPSPIGGWLYFLEVGWDQHPASLPEVSDLLAGLHGVKGSERVYDLPFFDSVALNPQLDSIISSGRDRLPHPWFDVFIPGSHIVDFATEFFSELKGSETERDFPTPFYPLRPNLSHRPLLRLPQTEEAFLFDFLCTLTDPGQIDRTLERNQKYYDRAIEIGGTLYPIGATPLTQEQWRNHYGPSWAAFTATKQRFDPENILGPGPGIF